MIAALANGAEALIPVAEIDESLELRQRDPAIPLAAEVLAGGFWRLFPHCELRRTSGLIDVSHQCIRKSEAVPDFTKGVGCHTQVDAHWSA